MWFALTIIGAFTGTLLHWTIPFIVGIPILPLIEPLTDNALIFTTIRQRVIWKLKGELCGCGLRPYHGIYEQCIVCKMEEDYGKLFQPIHLSRFFAFLRSNNPR